MYGARESPLVRKIVFHFLSSLFLSVNSNLDVPKIIFQSIIGGKKKHVLYVRCAHLILIRTSSAQVYVH